MKKPKILIFLSVFLLLLVIIFLIDNTPIEDRKKYHIYSEQKNNFLLSIAFYIIKPIIENYIDSRLETNIFIRHIEKQNFINKAMNITDIKIGSGKSVVCGQTVTISVSDRSEKEKVLTMKIGSHEESIFNVGLIGMKKGGIRSINFHKNVVINMIDVLDCYPQNLEEMLIFSSKSLDKKAFMCGESIKIHYKIKDLHKNTVLDGKTNFTLGFREVPIAIEQGSIEIQKDDIRVVLTPKNLLEVTKNMKNEDIDRFKNAIFKDELYIVEIMLIE